MIRRSIWRAVASLFLVAVLLPTASAADYLQEVKPLLLRRCAACHGALQQKQGLRIDTVDALLRGGESGPLLVPGDPGKSLLLQVVTGEGGLRMPPEGEGAPLTAAEVELLRGWVAAGAPHPADEEPQVAPAEYWSYRPPVRSPLSSLPAERRAWVRQEIDTFIATEHARLGLTASPAAPGETWLRRVALDLTGLPPTPAELEDFTADTAPDREVRVVDRLLARPTYGERWGRHWMDVWRYSDWYGSRGINEIRYSQRHIWRWRDWIVRSLNADASYAWMLEQMLAADELAPADPAALAATGFLGRNWYKFDRNVWMFETVEQTAQAFMATTLKCARCHDHKYDPFTQEDYYRFRAVFEPHDVRTDRLSAETPTEKDATLGQVLKDGVARVYDRQLDVATYVFQRGDGRYPDETRRMLPGVPAVFRSGELAPEPVSLPAAAYYPALRPELSAGLLAQARSRVEQARQVLESLGREERETQQRVADAVPLAAAGPAPARTPPLLHTQFAAADAALWKPLSGRWTWDQGKLVQQQVTSFATLEFTRPLPPQFAVRLRYRTLPAGTLRSVGFSYDYLDTGNSQDVYTSTGDQRQSLQAFHRLQGQQHYPPAGIVPVTLQVGQEVVVEAEVRGTQLQLKLNGESRLAYTLPVPRRAGRFALWVHDGSAEFLELEIRPLEPSLDDLQRAARTAQQARELQERRLQTATLQEVSLQARLTAEKRRYGVEPGDAATAAMEASRAQRAAALAQREEEWLAAHQQLAEAQRAGVAAAITTAEKNQAAAATAVTQAQQQLAQPDDKYEPVGEVYPSQTTGRRRALARWLTTPRHPRTSRVAVNHLWLRHFGQALVPSVSNFGLQGDRPSHPALLDWLAVELEDHDWQMKPLHRQFVLSATYGQSTAEAPDSGAAVASGRRLDPTNRFLWRMNSRRMEAEVVRDSVLAAAGQLDQALGGPEIPEGDGQKVTRRSLYFRLTPNEKMRFLETFDAADPNGCYRRRESVVPQQALVLMNSALALDAARELADRLLGAVAVTGPASPVTTAPPGAVPADDEAVDERLVVTAFRAVLSRTPTAAEQAACREFLRVQAATSTSPPGPVFPAGNPVRRPPAADPRQRAREDLVHVLFNHNDFVTIR
ncbi:MAG: PSD1 and planctomycete cytochrome C domain-containing protein [Pirellulales bacterium]